MPFFHYFYNFHEEYEEPAEEPAEEYGGEDETYEAGEEEEEEVGEEPLVVEEPVEGISEPPKCMGKPAPPQNPNRPTLTKADLDQLLKEIDEQEREESGSCGVQ